MADGGGHALFPEVHETQVDGVRVLWADAPGPLTAGLTFAVGRAHETLSTSGLTHVVEHLALATGETYEHGYNGMVDQTTATFVATGETGQIASFFRRVTERLTRLPLDRLEIERQVLLTEAESRGGSPFDGVTWRRFGARGFGLAGLAELGLRRLTAGEVDQWARERFVRSAACFWVTGSPPPELSLDALSQGEPVAPPDPRAVLPGRERRFVDSAPGGCAFSMLARRSAALRIALWVVEERARREIRHERGLAYDVGIVHDVIGRRDAHLLVGVDALPDKAHDAANVLLDVVDAVASNGPTEEELAAAKRVMTSAFSDARSVPGLLVAVAKDALLGGDRRPVEEIVAGMQAVQAGDVAAAVHTAAASLLAEVPPGVDLSPRLEPLTGSGNASAIEGRAFKTAPRAFGGVEIVVGPSGVTYRDGKDVRTVTYDQCVAAIETAEGAIVLVDVTGGGIAVDPTEIPRGLELRREITERIRPELVVPAEPKAARRAAVERAAGKHLLRRWRVERELEALSDELREDEEIQLLAEAGRGMTNGMLAVTSDRVMFVYIPVRKDPRFEAVERADVGRIETKGDRFTVHPKRGPALKLEGIAPWERAQEATRLLGGFVPRRDPRLLEWVELRPVAFAVAALVYALAAGMSFGTIGFGVCAIGDVWLSGHLSRSRRAPRFWLHVAAMIGGAAALVLAFVR